MWTRHLSPKVFDSNRHHLPAMAALELHRFRRLWRLLRSVEIKRILVSGVHQLYVNGDRLGFNGVARICLWYLHFLPTAWALHDLARDFFWAGDLAVAGRT
jgi:hypothetical protein